MLKRIQILRKINQRSIDTDEEPNLFPNEDINFNHHIKKFKINQELNYQNIQKVVDKIKKKFDILKENYTQDQIDNLLQLESFIRHQIIHKNKKDQDNQI